MKAICVAALDPIVIAVIITTKFIYRYFISSQEKQVILLS